MRKTKKFVYKFLSLLTLFSLMFSLIVSPSPTGASADPENKPNESNTDTLTCQEIQSNYKEVYDSVTQKTDNTVIADASPNILPDKIQGHFGVTSTFEGELYFVFNDSECTNYVIGRQGSSDRFNLNNIPNEGSFKVYVLGPNITEKPVGLEFNVTAPGVAAIDKEKGVAIANLTTSITPKGVIADSTRRAPIDVVFIFDTSGSMVLDMGNNRKSDPDKLVKAKEGAYKAIETFKSNAIEGDRFALVPFAGKIGTVTGFNENTSVDGTQSHLNSIKTSISNLNANGGTNYYEALKKANDLLKSSNKPKYVIFLTDGHPDTDARLGNNSNYENINISGDFQKWEKTTREIRERKCGFLGFNCRWVTKTVEDWYWSTTKYPINATSVAVRIEDKAGKNAVFTHNNETYLYYKNDRDLDYSYARVAASKLAEYGIKLLSIGFGSKNDVDFDFLAQLSNLTGASAQLGGKADISKIFEDVSKLINQQALRNIKVKVKIKDSSFPGNVLIGENAVIDPKDPEYAIVNFSDIQYEAGKMPPAPGPKLFSLTFDQPGSYTFNDVKLFYTDLSNTAQTSTGNAITIVITNNQSVGIGFKDPMYEIDVYNDQLSVDLTNEIIPVPEDAEIPEDITWEWTSSNEDVARPTNSNSGVIIPTGVGTTEITVTAVEDPTLTATRPLKVNLKSLQFKKSSYPDADGKNMYNELIITPSGFKLPSDAIEWSTNGTVFKANGGVINQIDSKVGGFGIVTAKLADKYKLDPAENVKAATMVKVNSNRTNQGHSTNNEW